MAKNSNRYKNPTWYHKLLLEMLWAVCHTLNYSPRWFRFGLLQPLIVALLRVLRYRRKTILSNLENSFPEKSHAEIVAIMRGYYRTLGEVIVNTICLAGATPEHDGDVILWENWQEHIERNKGRDWIAMSSHFGCWEYYPLWGWTDPACQFISVYHPLKSVVFELFYQRLRRFAANITPVTMAEAVRYYLRHRSPEYTTVLGLVSDQSPRLQADTKWIDFLNRKTAFIEGGEHIGMKFGVPIYFTDISRVAAGRYSCRFIELYDGKEEVEPGAIIRRYAENLERMIRREPELWMWSHKRWKHTPEKQLERFGTTTL
jgi:KDO2-lipid IV(A) lauroyltransferase